MYNTLLFTHEFQIDDIYHIRTPLSGYTDLITVWMLISNKALSTITICFHNITRRSPR